MMLAVIRFDEAAKLFHKLREESFLFFTLCVCVCFFFCFCMARRFSFFNRPVTLGTKAEGSKAKENFFCFNKKYIFRGTLWLYNIFY